MGRCGVVRPSVCVCVCALGVYCWEHLELRNLANVSLFQSHARPKCRNRADDFIGYQGFGCAPFDVVTRHRKRRLNKEVQSFRDCSVRTICRWGVGGRPPIPPAFLGGSTPPHTPGQWGLHPHTPAFVDLSLFFDEKKQKIIKAKSS